MMTQPSGLSPIAPHGTRQAGRRAKPLCCRCRGGRRGDVAGALRRSGVRREELRSTLPACALTALVAPAACASVASVRPADGGPSRRTAPSDPSRSHGARRVCPTAHRHRPRSGGRDVGGFDAGCRPREPPEPPWPPGRRRRGLRPAGALGGGRIRSRPSPRRDVHDDVRRSGHRSCHAGPGPGGPSTPPSTAATAARSARWDRLARCSRTPRDALSG